MEYKPGFQKVRFEKDMYYTLIGEEGAVNFWQSTFYPYITVHVPLNGREQVETGNEACPFLFGRDCWWFEVRIPLMPKDEESIRELLMEVYKDEVLGYWARVRQEPVLAGVE